ncbi:unnamed protein product [Leptidea sinapis]|uniref:Uncharacterized protein n=1 Tax=Leptidea sinapis TaxID=189913 RepID=A0A5E4Q958_9NEOP|nr:unnamed protein product [Leptidea sinapis]
MIRPRSPLVMSDLRMEPSATRWAADAFPPERSALHHLAVTFPPSPASRYHERPSRGAFEGVEDQVSPFGYGRGEGADAGHGDPEWICSREKPRYDQLFQALGPVDGKLTGAGTYRPHSLTHSAICGAAATYSTRQSRKRALFNFPQHYPATARTIARVPRSEPAGLPLYVKLVLLLVRLWILDLVLFGCLALVLTGRPYMELRVRRAPATWLDRLTAAIWAAPHDVVRIRSFTQLFFSEYKYHWQPAVAILTMILTTL